AIHARGRRICTAREASRTSPGKRSHGRANQAAWSAPGARSRSAIIPESQPGVEKPSASAYHGSARKPAVPTTLQIKALRGGRPAMAPPLPRQTIDLLLPPVDQPLPLGLGAVLREVVGDQLDLGELRRLRR